MRARPEALASTVAFFGLALAIPAAAQVTGVNDDIAFTVCDYPETGGDLTCDIWKMKPDGDPRAVGRPDRGSRGPRHH